MSSTPDNEVPEVELATDDELDMVLTDPPVESPYEDLEDPNAVQDDLGD